MKRTKILVGIAMFVIAYGAFSIGYVLSEQSLAQEAKGKVASGAITIAPPAPKDIWKLSNDRRVDAGLDPLTFDNRLNEAADEKCADMLERKYWSHKDPDGRPAWHLISSNYGYYSRAGENLAMGQTNSSDVVTQWMESKTHRENLLRPYYKDMGVAVCRSNTFMSEAGETVYFTVQLFAVK